MTLIKRRINNWPEIFNTHDNLELLHPISQELDAIFKNVFPGTFTDKFVTKGSYPKLDILEYEDKVTIETEVPGLTKKDVDICIKENILTISGKRKDIKTTEEKGKYITRELKKSEFSRSVILGDNINKADIDAEFKDGILLITLPKITEEKIEDDEIHITIK